MTEVSERPRDDREQKRSPEFSQELIEIISIHYKLLIFGPIIVAIAAYAIAMIVPGKYTSIAFLRLDVATARSMEALMSSPSIANKVLSKFPGTGTTPEEHVEYVDRNLRLTDIEPLGSRSAERLFRLSILNSNPKNAQSISSALIEAWLATTQPGPVERNEIHCKIERLGLSIANNTQLIEKLKSEATVLVMPNSMQGEIATPISKLVAQRNWDQDQQNELKAKLRGLSPDVIVEAPHLPVDPSWHRKGAVTILAFFASIPIILALVLIGRFIRGTSRLRSG